MCCCSTIFQNKKKDTFLQVEIKINLNRIFNAVCSHSQWIVYRLGNMRDCFCRQQRSNLMLSGTLKVDSMEGGMQERQGEQTVNWGLNISKGSGSRMRRQI